VALINFAMANQGVYQRCADVAIALLGVWTIVAACVLADGGRWLLFAAGAGLAGLGAVGLIVREVDLGRGLRIGHTRIEADQLVRASALAHDREARL
jgi:hypothetical protein